MNGSKICDHSSAYQAVLMDRIMWQSHEGAFANVLILFCYAIYHFCTLRKLVC